jgi:hypothetical protein
VQEILQTQLATYGEKSFDHYVFTYTDLATIYNLRATPVPVDNKLCEFCNDIGHLEEGCFHRVPLQLILNPPEIGYPDGNVPNDLLIKHQTPHNLYQERISSASEISGDLHGHRKFTRKEYDKDNTLPSAMQGFLSSLTNAPQLPIPSNL